MKRLFCRLFHRRISWPINHHYHCWTCGETYAVPYDRKRTRRKRLVERNTIQLRKEHYRNGGNRKAV